jgi:hypothetical protein
MNTTILVIAIVVALLGAVAITVIVIAPLAEAGCERGKGLPIAFNASKGRCFNP